MKTYNFYYNGQIISKSEFEKNVPWNWKSEVDEFGHYSFGYYTADERD